MRFLALILNDPPGGLPMIEPAEPGMRSWNYTIGVAYHICRLCKTFHASNRCD